MTASCCVLRLGTAHRLGQPLAWLPLPLCIVILTFGLIATPSTRTPSHLLDAFLERMLGQDTSTLRTILGSSKCHTLDRGPGRLQRGRDMATKSRTDDQGYTCSNPCTESHKPVSDHRSQNSSLIFSPDLTFSGLALHPIAAAEWPGGAMETACLCGASVSR